MNKLLKPVAFYGAAGFYVELKMTCAFHPAIRNHNKTYLAGR